MDRKSSFVHREDEDFECWIPNETHPKKLLEDEYLLGDVVGRDALSIVYNCLRKGRTEWACKVLKKKLLDKKLFQRKIQTLLNLRHPNVVQVKDVFETRDEIQLILELADGGELFERIVQKGCYTEKDAAHAVRQVLKALQYLHSKGIVHKGVKPEKILYKTAANDLMLQLSDVGVSMLMAGDNYVTHGTFGTFGLLAPEILQRHNYDTSLDLWNLGVVIYVMLCGFEPFWDRQIQAVTSKKIIEGDLTFPSPSWDKVSDGAKDLIKKLLSKDPKSRLTASEALNHPWVLGTSTPSAPMTDETLIKLREFNAKRRFRVATTAVIATKRALSYLPVVRSTEMEGKTVETYLNEMPPGGKPIDKMFIKDFGEFERSLANGASNNVKNGDYNSLKNFSKDGGPIEEKLSANLLFNKENYIDLR